MGVAVEGGAEAGALARTGRAALAAEVEHVTVRVDHAARAGRRLTKRPAISHCEPAENRQNRIGRTHGRSWVFFTSSDALASCSGCRSCSASIAAAAASRSGCRLSSIGQRAVAAEGSHSALAAATRAGRALARPRSRCRALAESGTVGDAHQLQLNMQRRGSRGERLSIDRNPPENSVL